MKIGLFGINAAGLSDPERMTRVARAADDAGLDSVWTGEHVVLVDPQVEPSPIPPEVPLVHPSTALAFVAASTSRILLGTGVTLLPQHNPLVVAKEFASLDHLSGGRLLFGVGVGYVAQEYEAMKISFDDRGERANEYLDAIRDMWTSSTPTLRGRFVSTAGINAYPRPVQQPPPILIGGSSRAAFRRVVERGSGWYGFGDPDRVAAARQAIEAALDRYDRPPELGPVRYCATPPTVPDAQMLDRFEALGVERLIIGFQAFGLPATTDGYLEWVDRLATIAARG